MIWLKENELHTPGPKKRFKIRSDKLISLLNDILIY
ncbi:MAG: hypothetical protein SBU_000925 [Candidatus Syntrophoarchaeum butanivorans]|uniref:Uncharacterized protein n=1 Tax=Candidatus Syntropharchaeum butanivorans TaxID=1839936 RepID=A0A1F2P5C5_9EURY|nr:MAG: hypothetical protein SBU_000925 [Candidatus Syntrophoarchaeum butanivorans]